MVLILLHEDKDIKDKVVIINKYVIYLHIWAVEVD